MEREWIPCKERLPELREINEYTKGSEFVLVQTNDGQMFIARLEKCGKIYWYSYGTKGRKMRVMNKVVSWMLLPEKYEDDADERDDQTEIP